MTDEGRPIRLTNTERIVDSSLRRLIIRGSLEITYPSGTTRHYGDHSRPIPILIKSLPVQKLLNPTMFFGESYMHGNIQIAEDDLDGLFRVMSENESDSLATKIVDKLPRRQSNRRSRQRAQISHHYDKGNDYYRLWLDDSLTYSCAFFRNESDTLEEAQKNKTEYLLRKLQLKPGMKLLDIGCGWGYLAIETARQYGVDVLGITLSSEQVTEARRLAKAAKVDSNVQFELANYQDLPGDLKYDRIISVGMFEHVGKSNHAQYFQKIKELLTEDGVSVLHTITTRNAHDTSPWIDKYIFPGGYLPTIDMIEKLLADFKFCSIDRENLWQHYAMTLDKWRERHRAHRTEIIAMFDKVFYRMQDFWLAGSAATFRYGGTGINQFIFTKKKPDSNRWPLTRKYMLDLHESIPAKTFA